MTTTDTMQDFRARPEVQSLVRGALAFLVETVLEDLEARDESSLTSALESRHRLAARREEADYARN